MGFRFYGGYLGCVDGVEAAGFRSLDRRDPCGVSQHLGFWEPSKHVGKSALKESVGPMELSVSVGRSVWLRVPHGRFRI